MGAHALPLQYLSPEINGPNIANDIAHEQMVNVSIATHKTQSRPKNFMQIAFS